MLGVADLRQQRGIPKGKRNNTLLRRLFRVRHCDDPDSLLDVARTLNMDCEPPLRDAEVVRITNSAWGYEVSGNNWVGRKARISRCSPALA